MVHEHFREMLISPVKINWQRAILLLPMLYLLATRHLGLIITLIILSELEIVIDTVTNTTIIFSLATKSTGLVATLVTRFLYVLDLN